MSYQPFASPYLPRQTSGMAVASMVLGISGIALSWCTFAIPSILGLVFGFIGLKQTENNAMEGRGMAIAGLITSGVVVILTVLFYLLWGIGSFATGLS